MIDLRAIPVLPFRKADALICGVRFAMRNIPYLWGGDDPAIGLDCSGFVAAMFYELSRTAIDIRATHNTVALWTQLDVVAKEQAQAGDIAFYGPRPERPVSHVMLYLGDGVVIGQPYGDQFSTDPATSKKEGRTSKCLPLLYRQDLVGFRRPRYAAPKVG